VAALGLSLVCALAAACRADSPRAATSSESSEVRTELTSILDSLYALADSLYFDEGAYQRAEAVFAQALQLARDRGSAREEADALTRLGLTAYRLGDYERARPVLEESLELKLEHHIDDQRLQRKPVQ
jgi:tetratricopeptide (TPR) repeat protein